MCPYTYDEIVGTSETSWEDAALAAVQTAQETGTLRIAQVVEMDLDLAGDEARFRTKLSISYKYSE